MKHPIKDRPPVGTPEARAAALCYLAAACHMRRAKEAIAAFDKGEIVMQMTLAENPDDLALIGKMSGRMGRACMDMLGIDENGFLPGGPVR
jgi:hypothetical protein